MEPLFIFTSYSYCLNNLSGLIKSFLEPNLCRFFDNLNLNHFAIREG